MFLQGALHYLQRQRDEAIAVIVVLLKHIRHPLQADAALHEHIEADGAVAALVIDLEHLPHEGLAQAVPEGYQRVRVLGQADVPAVVGVESIEQAAPRSQEPPQPAEFVEPDRPAAVRVEHPDHHLHS
jgi:hypothetical protein